MPEILTADHGKESGHWYTQSGEPAYTIIGKNGVERATTLRDAKKENPHLVPGVTTILNCAAKPGLDNWKIDQAILAALTCPRIDDEPEADYLLRIKLDAREQAKKAVERGILIHAWVQQGFEHKPIPHEILLFFSSAAKTLDDECGPTKWICEKSFAADGYGGKVDLFFNDVIDIKTTEKDLTTIKTWDEHSLQLAAYRNGLGLYQARCGILYIHVKTTESKLIWIPEVELQRGWRMFTCLKDFWYADKGLEAT